MRKNYRVVATLEIKDTLIKAAEKRQDDWGTEVYGRLAGIIDLVAEEAKYHLKCKLAFRRDAPTELGRPRVDGKQVLFEKLCDWLEDEAENGVFDISEMQEKLLDLDTTDEKEHSFSKRYLKQKLIEAFDNEIYFTNEMGREDILCFRNITNKILREFFSGRANNLEEEKQRIILTAAALIKNDINLAELTTITYPTTKEMSDTSSLVVPDSVKQFYSQFLKSNYKVEVYAQNLVKACKLRSGVMPFLMGLTIQLDHRYGSKWLIDRMHNLGYCESYNELNRYKYSYLTEKSSYKTEKPSRELQLCEEEIRDISDLPVQILSICEENNTPKHSRESSFMQFVGDNMDLNLTSIYDNSPFHAMGRIIVTTPATSYNKYPIKRVKFNKDNKQTILSMCEVEISRFIPNKLDGLKTVRLKPIESITLKKPSTSLSDVAWIGGRLIKKIDESFVHPDWNGFMKEIHKEESVEKSSIEYLPIVDADPNNLDTIYTAIIRCMGLSKGKAITITFDLPIWFKAMRIVIEKNLPVVVRLGGFHFLKSYLGAIGTIMSGSGLEDVLKLVYKGSSTVEHILSGCAYAKAIRAHLLVDAALCVIGLRDVFTEEDLQNVKEIVHKMKDKKQGTNRTSLLIALEMKVNDTLEKHSQKGRTSKLWVEYHYMVNRIKNFIRAERTHDWDLHMQCVGDMLDTFAAAGHGKYAKGGRLYLQVMLESNDTYKDIFEEFTIHGYHTVRYSDFE